jgi:Dyp-type peroxidase family
MDSALDLASIQGNVIPGFNKDHQAFVFIHFPYREAALSWLHSLRNENTWDITSAEEVETFKKLRKLAEARRRGNEAHLVSACWLNIAFSPQGLQLLLEGSEDGLFDGELRENQFKRNRLPTPASPNAEVDVHALVVVAADRSRDLRKELDLQQARITRCGATVIDTWEGDTLPEGREHFGFKDGLSQPRVAGAPKTSRAVGALVNPGEFILGYNNATGAQELANPPLTRNGSYLVFLKLKQDVAAFRNAVASESKRTSIATEELEAATVGWFRDGRPLELPFKRLAHSGRAHPDREVLHGENPDRHRIIRRGIPYGAPLKGSKDDGQDRGLLFLGYQANIRTQFEHVWLSWLNNSDFPAEEVGTDPLVGHSTTPHQSRAALVARLDDDGGTAQLRLPEFVSLIYGGYFFSPSIPALARLADGVAATPVREKEIGMTFYRGQGIQGQGIQGLGMQPAPEPPTARIRLLNGGVPDYMGFFVQQNPYGIINDANLQVNLNDVELDGPAATSGLGTAPYSRSVIDFVQAQANQSSDPLADFRYWHFRGQDHRISKALRIWYTYDNPDDRPPFRGYILIGYAGPSWP